MKKTYRENNNEVLINCKYVAMMWRNTEMCSAKRQTPIKISGIYSVFPENIYEFKIQGG
jgi:hypothetical protein